MPSCAGACDCSSNCACACSSECTIKTVDISATEKRRYEQLVETLYDEIYNLRIMNRELLERLLEKGD